MFLLGLSARPAPRLRRVCLPQVCSRANLRAVNRATNSVPASGTVASLHVHCAKSGGPLVAAEFLALVADKGIANDPRYFDRGSRRQVSLIAREQIAEHADAFALAEISPGVVRSNIETLGLELQSLLGWEVRVGSAVVFFYAPRTPCAKMDAICVGLRERMGDARQGVLAQVVTSGRVACGDAVTPLSFVAPTRPHLP